MENETVKQQIALCSTSRGSPAVCQLGEPEVPQHQPWREEASAPGTSEQPRRVQSDKPTPIRALAARDVRKCGLVRKGGECQKCRLSWFVGHVDEVTVSVPSWNIWGLVTVLIFRLRFLGSEAVGGVSGLS